MSELERLGRIFKVWKFDPSHRQLILRSDATAIDGTTTRVEVYFGHVECMLLKSVYRGVRIRRASDGEYVRIAEFTAVKPESREWLWLLEDAGNDFVVSSKPAWREAPRGFKDASLFDFDQQWPPGPDVTWGEVG
jgi:hypothetical protein